MIIEIGTIFRGICGAKKPLLGINIPGIGVLKSEDDEDDNPFARVILDKKHLKKLRSEIDKELNQEVNNV